MSIIPCTKNPIVEYIKYVIEQYEIDPSFYDDSLYSAFDSFFNVVFTSNINTEYCCPSCGTYGIVFTSQNAANFLEFQNTKNSGCCLNYYGTDVKDENFTSFINMIDEYEYQNCCNDFQDCSEKLLDLMQSKYKTPINSTILGLGIYEISLLSGKTVTCDLYEYLTTSSLSDEYLYSIFRFIITNGLMVQCNIGEGGIFETTVSVTLD